MNAVMKQLKMEIGWSEISRGGKRVEIALYSDNLVLCGESEKDLRAIVGRFIEVLLRTS